MGEYTQFEKQGLKRVFQPEVLSNPITHLAPPLCSSSSTPPNTHCGSAGLGRANAWPFLVWRSERLAPSGGNVTCGDDYGNDTDDDKGFDNGGADDPNQNGKLQEEKTCKLSPDRLPGSPSTETKTG